MATDTLKMMKEQLMSCVQGQLGDISKVDAHELGEAVDMIKDLAEAIYYCTITDSMEKSEDNNNQSSTNINYYTTPVYNGKMQYPDIDAYRNMERSNGYMYYPPYPMYYQGQGNDSMGMNGGSRNGTNTSTNYYTEPLPSDMRRDPREGRSYIRRRMYMEGKEMHKDTNSQMKELEAYLQELSTDITEMIRDASAEEKATLRQKMTNLANKIN